MSKIVNEPALVVLAAGMGSRFGGSKQVTSIGPSGERIIDYSVFDAIKAGFQHIVFIITEEMHEDFAREIGDVIAQHANVYYCYQKTSDIPNGFEVPAERVKPWGTGHATLAARDIVKGPFAVINADDFYGRESFSILHNFLMTNSAAEKSRLHIALVSYQLSKTMTENGSVSRGVCNVDTKGNLLNINERTTILWKDGVPVYTEDDGKTYHFLDEKTPVSMNCWGFPEGVMEHFANQFLEFIADNISTAKNEFFLPAAVDKMVERAQADVQVLPTNESWYGMTYAEDKNFVTQAINELVDKGVYPEKLW